ncbi:cytochrome-c oxidase, cbb3-type subunit III [Granulosicoccus sp. 3-233]|uniref:cytochrome-c oxidase, cbb3-type subunit III n=1 Tax=Granulosicoccus sp. 3-233 TaxID=3417969 RepID=UPI003D3393C1
MADFLSGFWSHYVSIITIVSIVACFLLAFLTSRAKLPPPVNGEVETTGHVWDGDLAELNNPLPRWWLYLFYITCIFSAGYLILYPGLGSFDGVLNWSAAGQYEEEVASMDEVTAPLFAEYLAQDIPAVAANPDAVAMGERLFLTYCSQCHGSDARGSRSFPNLADNDWLGAGTPEHIKNTVLNGRNAVMPPMMAAIGNTPEDVTAMANYVLSLSDSRHDAALAEKAKPRFAVCGACHGMDGKGNPAVGAPNLTDDIWLYGGSLSSVEYAISNGFNNRMPAFGELLGEGKAHVVAAYIWSLSNSPEKTASAN